MKSSRNAASPAPDANVADVVAVGRAHPEALADLRAVYADADAAAIRAGLTCLGGGGCCHFHVFGHRLYLTALELAELTTTPPPQPVEPGRCPYQIDPRCAAYARRPLGCRTFFCSAAGDGPDRVSHENLHERIRRIHETRCIPYVYAELCAMIERTHQP